MRDALRHLLGNSLPGPGFAEARTETRTDLDGWPLDRLIFRSADGAEDIPTLFLRPPDGHAKVPAVLYAHAHGNRYDRGCDELTAGRPSLQGPYAPDLRRLGIAALCLEMPCFGARQHPGEAARAKALLWQGRTLFGQMLDELQAGVGYLENQPFIDADRIGALGFSMGSTLAWWLAALDPRIRAASALCSFADLGHLVSSGAHDGHGIYMTVPGLLPVARSGQIAGLAAPRALQICVGLQDWSTPKDAFECARADVEEAYRAAGAEAHLTFHVSPDTGHAETPQMRADVLTFLHRTLCH
ncbi:alpha/beta hydrolase [Thalassococcus sp. BH17M4-6]|uniref:alpha/beta hydrolase n=1 Tax=Thalassococcus sp. BH17M4-6 TaxID=3413148 RepID=UPI003BD3EB3D